MTTDNVTALRFTGVGDVAVAMEQWRSPIEGESVIEPLAVGVCGTDAHIVAGHFEAAQGVVLGHEICGRVVEIAGGSDSIAVGDLVTVEPHNFCTRCPYCRSGREHLCDKKRGYGVKLDGGMATRMVVPTRILYRLPADTQPWIGALTEPVACCIHAMDQLEPISGESILIYGCGPAGAILVSLARLSGLTPIVVVEPSTRRRELALRMGAHVALDPCDEADMERLESIVEHRGYRRVVDAVGSGRIVEQAVAAAGRGARIMVFGVSRPGDLAQISPRDIFQKELTIVGSVINPYTHQRAVAMLRELRLDRLHPAFFTLDQFQAALDAQAAGEVDKVFITPVP
jgi:L-iditol 2-dehydrogenase